MVVFQMKTCSPTPKDSLLPLRQTARSDRLSRNHTSGSCVAALLAIFGSFVSCVRLLLPDSRASFRLVEVFPDVLCPLPCCTFGNRYRQRFRLAPTGKLSAPAFGGSNSAAMLRCSFPDAADSNRRSQRVSRNEYSTASFIRL